MKITKEDLKTVRREIEAIARRWSRATRFVVFVGARHNVERPTPDGAHVNVLLVTDRDDWGDTDLWDNSIPWATMRGDLQTTADGKAAFDFWIYEPGRPGEREGHGDLVCNAQAYFDAHGLQRIEADVETTWTRERVAA